MKCVNPEGKGAGPGKWQFIKYEVIFPGQGDISHQEHTRLEKA
jgi:hypothetical protein